MQIYGIIIARLRRKYKMTGGTADDKLNGNTLTGIDTGLANSEAIVNQFGHTDSAAKLCLDYDDGTYDDWFLPSKDELNLMYLNLHLNGIGDFDSYYNWSSSEYDATQSWVHEFDDSNPNYRLKYQGENVRAVREF